VEYVAEYVRVSCSVVSFVAADRATVWEVENALRKLKDANYVFAGPGSGARAVQNWRNTPVFELVASRVADGEQPALADAVTVVHADACEYSRDRREPVDLVFLDAEKEESLRFLDPIVPILPAGVLLLADNVIPHAKDLAGHRRRANSDCSLPPIVAPIRGR
jgi:hypothetical protein